MSDQAAFQDIDDDVRQDDLNAWWKRWGDYVVVDRGLAALASAQLRPTPEEQVAALLAVAPQLPAELSDLATVIAGFRSVGTPKEGEVAAKLESLAQPERPFHASALELEALAAARKGDLVAARKLWNEIIKDPAAPQGAQQRAQALLTLYGLAEGK